MRSEITENDHKMSADDELRAVATFSHFLAHQKDKYPHFITKTWRIYMNVSAGKSKEQPNRTEGKIETETKREKASERVRGRLSEWEKSM